MNVKNTQRTKKHNMFSDVIMCRGLELFFQSVCKTQVIASLLSNKLQIASLLLLQKEVMILLGGHAVALQAGRSRVRFPMMSLTFFIDIILSPALRSWVRPSL